MDHKLIEETKSVIAAIELVKNLDSIGSDFVTDILRLSNPKGDKTISNKVISAVNSILIDCKNKQFASALTTLENLSKIKSKIIFNYVPRLRKPIKKYLSTL